MNDNAVTRLCDLSDCTVMRVSGTDAARFLEIMTTTDFRSLADVGDFAQGLVLTAEAQVIDLVNLLRTGDDEYLVCCDPRNGAEVYDWLSAYCDISDEQGRVFPELSLSDESAHVALLACYGSGSAEMLDNLQAACEGKVSLITKRLDAPAYGFPDLPCALLVAPINAASAIGDFLLEDPEVFVETIEEYRDALVVAGKMVPELYEGAYASPKKLGLMDYVRTTGGFVGSRQLAENLS